MLLLILLAASPTAEANAAGMKAYQAKKYPEAIELFRKAISVGEEELTGATLKEEVQLTRTKALAHFNLACTLALVRKAGKVCDFDAYRSTIVEEVQHAIRLDPNRIEKALTDPDLSGIRDTLAFQSWQGLSPRREADLPKLLVGVKWWSQGVGVYGSTNDLAFTAQSVTLTMLVLDAEGVPLKTRKVVTGKWSLSGRTLKIVFPAVVPELKKSSLEGTFKDSGRLEFKEWVEFTDSPSECDA